MFCSHSLPGVWPLPAFGRITSHSIVLRLPASVTQVTYDIYMKTFGEPWSKMSPVQSQRKAIRYEVQAQPDTTYWFAFEVRSGNLTSHRSAVRSVTTENPG